MWKGPRRKLHAAGYNIVRLPQRRAERALVEIVELAAYGTPWASRVIPDRQMPQRISEVMRRGLAVHRGIQRDDDLLDPGLGGARDEAGDAELFRTDPVEGVTGTPPST